MKEEKEAEEMKLRQRRVRRGNKLKLYSNNDDVDDDDDEQPSKMVRRRVVARHGQGGILANKLIVGLTFTVGVAAFAMYAMNSNPKDPQELLSKVFHLLSYKDF